MLQRISIMLRAACGAVLVLALGAITAHAQFRAGFQGSVVDPQGAVVAGATLTLTNKETNLTKQTQTDAAGTYAFVELPPGHYSIAVEKAGFKRRVISDVVLQAEKVQALNVTLELGQETQTVSVSAVVPNIDTENGAIAGTITSNMVDKLPSFGRDVFQLAYLAPGAFGDGAQSAGGGSNNLPGANQGASGNSDGIFKTENGPQVVANGTQLEANNIALNGIGITSAVWGGSAVVTPNEESVKEVNIVTNSYDAENGRYSGAQIQVVSQNGTDELHGSAFFKADRPGLNAFQKWNGPFNSVQKDTQRFNQFGGSLGGPIWKHKVFGFFSYEGLHNDSTNFGNGWYETPQLDKMAPAGSIASKYLTFPGEGATFSSIVNVPCAAIGLAEGVNCATIPGAGLDVGSPLKTPLGTPDPTYGGTVNTPGVGSGLDGIPDLAFVNTVSPSTVSDAQYNGRVDFNVTDRDLVAFSIYKVPVTNTSFNGPNRAANLWHHTSMNEAETLLWNHTISPTVINEARANAAGWRWNEIRTNHQEPFGLPTGAIDNIGSASPNSFGPPGPSIFDQWTYSVKDVLSKVQGSHMLKFGGDVTRLLMVDDAPWDARPQYNFRNLWDFLNDTPYLECCSNFNPMTGVPTDERKDNRDNIFGIFAQDNYKLKPNLTLTYGLRWEYFGPLTEKGGHQSQLLLGSGANTLTGMRLRLGGGLWQADKANLGPQLGFAWSPHSLIGHNFTNRLVIRGGLGIGYTAEELAITTNGRFNPPLVSNFTNLTILYALASNIHSLDGYPSNPSAITPFGPNNIPTSGSPVSVTGFPAHFATPYTERYSLEAQYDFGGNWVGTLGYQGSSSRHFTRQTDLNLTLAGVVPFNPMVSFVDWYANDANGNFNALLAEIQHRFSRSFEADAQYRLSRCMDEGSQPYNVDQYEWNPAAAYGPCDYNATHAFKVWGIWSPTLFRGRHSWLEKVAGGWSISEILTAHSGFPYTVVYNNGNTCNAVFANNGGFTCNLRPAAYLGGASQDTSNSIFMKQGGQFPKGGLAYFTLPTFVAGPNFPLAGPIPQAPGVGRNSLTGPHYFDVDATLTKAFGLPNMKVLGENAKFEIQASFYNLFNKLNLTNVDNNINDPYFGTAMNALGSRTIEIQGKFNF